MSKNWLNPVKTLPIRLLAKPPAGRFFNGGLHESTGYTEKRHYIGVPYFDGDDGAGKSAHVSV